MTTKTQLTLKRHFDVSPEIAYRAWVDPEQLETWWGPNELEENEVESLDVRVGGSYHIVTNAASGDRYNFRGQYREIIPNKKISFTWDTAEHRECVVTAEFGADSTGTNLTLRHLGLANAEERESYREGWEGALEKLERLIAQAGRAGKLSRSTHFADAIAFQLSATAGLSRTTTLISSQHVATRSSCAHC